MNNQKNWIVAGAIFIGAGMAGCQTTTSVPMAPDKPSCELVNESKIKACIKQWESYTETQFYRLKLCRGNEGDDCQAIKDDILHSTRIIQDMDFLIKTSHLQNGKV